MLKSMLNIIFVKVNNINKINLYIIDKIKQLRRKTGAVILSVFCLIAEGNTDILSSYNEMIVNIYELCLTCNISEFV